MRTGLLLVLALSAGCAKSGGAVKAAAEDADIKPVVEKTLPDGLILQEVDLNGDRQADVFNYFRERTNAPRLLVRKELDLNMDGKVDVITYFNDEGQIEREEMDGDFDGTFDWIDHYQLTEKAKEAGLKDPQRVMSEVDTDHDGKMDVFSYYDGDHGEITRKERDTNGDGLVDYWERFDNEGNVTRTGRDTDGDGKMDERDE